jgi:hypothetical protein
MAEQEVEMIVIKLIDILNNEFIYRFKVRPISVTVF